ncbi:uncharacterized protein LOC143547554 [Bidens hawaiensis]|uniref:uncharacterized protein LOC143547554 n=1 Tax=Bidens hawaiensis TaxID=980011 RepID=UPI00404AB121
MSFLGFGGKWMSWIRACLYYARSSILINGSPTEELKIERGLRQGDPLSPFLFIIAMEGLHMAIEDIVQARFFKGAKIGRGNMYISHLFYANDIIVLEEWSLRNIKNIVMALNCLYLASGLKQNIHKYNLFGVGVVQREVRYFADIVECRPEKIPFLYLGISWRFVNNPNSTWVKVLKAIYGSKLNQDGMSRAIKGNGIWSPIVKSINKLNDEDLIPASVIRIKVGNGSETLFWKDVWIGDSSLCSRFPRLFDLEVNKNCLLKEKLFNSVWVWNWRRRPRGGVEDTQLEELISLLDSVSLSDPDDKWIWKLDSDDAFSVKGVRSYLDCQELPESNITTR